MFSPSLMISKTICVSDSNRFFGHLTQAQNSFTLLPTAPVRSLLLVSEVVSGPLLNNRSAHSTLHLSGSSLSHHFA